MATITTSSSAPLVLTVGAAESADMYESEGRIYEYTSAANPTLPPVPVLAHDPLQHQTGSTRVIPFDLSSQLGVEYAATSPNLMASYLRILAGESLDTSASATSQAFYIIQGAGRTESEFSTVEWSQGDLFVFPCTQHKATHIATEDTAIYWVHDEPLLRYLGVLPSIQRFRPAVFKKDTMVTEVERIRHAPGAEHKNRLGILLGNRETDANTKTLTHTLWSLLNVLPAGDVQPPHRHNSVALDLAVHAAPEGVYTLMGPELDERGWVKDPIRVEWKEGGVFVTPPGWWHSHHNESEQDAWVLPMQDAGLYTYQRTLNIQFSTGRKSDLVHSPRHNLQTQV